MGIWSLNSAISLVLALMFKKIEGFGYVCYYSLFNRKRGDLEKVVLVVGLLGLRYVPSFAEDCKWPN